jgi:GDP-L-fucose synthase
MIRKFHDAKQNNSDVTLWGSGNPLREFLFVDDLADGVLFAIENNLEESIYNIGTGLDISIKNLALLIQKVIGHTGDILWDSSKPDGTPRKLLSVEKVSSLGWTAATTLEDGIKKTYTWYLENEKNIKEVKIK